MTITRHVHLIIIVKVLYTKKLYKLYLQMHMNKMA